MWRENSCTEVGHRQTCDLLCTAKLLVALLLYWRLTMWAEPTITGASCLIKATSLVAVLKAISLVGHAKSNLIGGLVPWYKLLKTWHNRQQLIWNHMFVVFMPCAHYLHVQCISGSSEKNGTVSVRSFLKGVGLGFSKELSTRCRSFHLIRINHFY